MSMKLPIVLLCALALTGLSACGGGNDGLSTAEEEALQQRVETAEEARKQAEADKRKAEQDATAAEEARKQAEADKEKADQDAAAADQKAEQDAVAAEETQEQLEQAQQANQQLQQELTEAERAELRARASSFGAELDLGDGATAPADTTAGVSATATVSWTRGSSLTFRPDGTVLTPGSAAPSAPGGWRSASFTGQSGTATALIDETVYLYTNIQAPSSRAFWKVHNVQVETAQDDGDFDPTPTAAAQYITDSADNTMASGVRVSGSYDGVSGTFTCTESACMGERTGESALDLTGLVGAPVNGVRSFAGGTWTFKPGSIATRVKAEDQADQDDAYLYFGVWSSIPNSITGTYDFRYLAGGGAETGSELANFNALVGPATFRGGAVGRYVTQGQVGQQNAKIGSFTATATLNADFGDGDTPGSLSGSITDFREGGSPLAGWRVTMGSSANVGVASTISGTTATGSTAANIGGLSVGGSWGASFYGSDNEVLDDRDKYPASRYPVVDLAGVAGWFDASGSGTNDASLAGAFAATPQ